MIYADVRHSGESFLALFTTGKTLQCPQRAMSGQCCNWFSTRLPMRVNR